jgi:hypothetical protein
MGRHARDTQRAGAADAIVSKVVKEPFYWLQIFLWQAQRQQLAPQRIGFRNPDGIRL